MQVRTLDALDQGQSAIIGRISTMDRRTRRHIQDMGLTPLTPVTLERRAPMGDPIEISVRGYTLSLRLADARQIFLLTDEEAAKCKANASELDKTAAAKHKSGVYETDLESHNRAATIARFVTHSCGASCAGCKCGGACMTALKTPKLADDKSLKFALAGNPNCGKTTLFNAMTGAREYVGNRAGVTVEKKEGRIRGGGKDGVFALGHEATLVDLPGIYSLSPYSPEEMAARDHIINEKPDAIINIVDATNLERNLYLTLQLMELDRPMVIALNMMDEVRRNGGEIDCERLSFELGVPVVPISARTGEGIEELKASAKKLLAAAHTLYHNNLSTEPDDIYDAATRDAHRRLGELIGERAREKQLCEHWVEMKLLERDDDTLARLELTDGMRAEVEKTVAQFDAKSPFGDGEGHIADCRYRYIERVCAKAVKKDSSLGNKARSSKIDRLLTNKYLALPLFLLIMLSIFMLTFSTLGAFLRDSMGLLIDEVIAPYVGGLLLHAPQWLSSLMLEGIIAGVGGVVTFLPQIALLFLCLSILEDSGYMSRIAFIMDKPMRKIGLSGKSIIPLLMGFGCTVPAVMAARSLESERSRRVTIMLTPFMSCSAKLPVYGLIASAMFPRSSGLVIFALYIGGILVALLSGLLLKRAAAKEAQAPFVMELPPYRMPKFSDTLEHVWEKMKHFLEKAGSIIFVMSIVIWLLQSFDAGLNMVENPQNSLLSILGKAIAPIFTPLGFGTWQAAVALLTGIIAKEAIVSTLSLLYGFASTAGAATVAGALGPAFSGAAASFLTFVLLYTPCMAATTTIWRELGGGKRTLLLLLYQLTVAYLAAFAVYLIGSLII